MATVVGRNDGLDQTAGPTDMSILNLVHWMLVEPTRPNFKLLSDKIAKHSKVCDLQPLWPMGLTRETPQLSVICEVRLTKKLDVIISVKRYSHTRLLRKSYPWTDLLWSKITASISEV